MEGFHESSGPAVAAGLTVIMVGVGPHSVVFIFEVAEFLLEAGDVELS
jgi:hypothetical protein